MYRYKYIVTADGVDTDYWYWYEDEARDTVEELMELDDSRTYEIRIERVDDDFFKVFG